MGKHEQRVSAFRISVLAIGLYLVFLNKCTFKLPSEAPTWDVNLIIPLINRLYTIEEIIEDSDDLIIDQQNEQIIFTKEEEIGRFEVGENLQIGGSTSMVTILAPQNATVGWQRSQAGEAVLPDDIMVDHATVESGQVVLNVDNQSGYVGRIEVDIPSMTLGGNALRIQFDVAPGSSQQRQVNLSGYRISPRNAGGRSRIDYDSKVTVVSIQTVQAGNFFIRFDITDIVFTEVTGTFNEVDVPFVETEMEIDIPKELEGFMVGSAELELLLMIGVQIPVRFLLTIEGFEPRNARAAPVQIDTWVVPNTRGITNIFVPDVTDMLNSQPARVRITGTLKVGNGTTLATVYDTSSVSGSFLFRAPLIISLPQQTTTADVDTLEIEEDARDAVRDNLMELVVVADIENHVPISGNVSLYFSKTRGDETLYDQPDLIIGPVPFSQAVLTNDDPRIVDTPGMSQWTHILTKNNDIVLFEEEELYWGVKFDFNSTQGELAKIRPLDYIRVQAYGTATVHTKIPDEDDEEGGGS